MNTLKTSPLLFLLMIVFLTACGDKDEPKVNARKGDIIKKEITKNDILKEAITKEALKAELPTEITWDALIADAFQPETIMAKYQSQLDKFDAEEYSPEAGAFYDKINAELNNAPLNQGINNKLIKLPGYIAPLNQVNGLITEFLLVPYFGACIHVPPPPINQTILVKVASNNGIKIDDSFGSFWVSGTILIDNKKTDIGEAGYRIENAVIEIYSE